MTGLTFELVVAVQEGGGFSAAGDDAPEVDAIDAEGAGIRNDPDVAGRMDPTRIWLAFFGRCPQHVESITQQVSCVNRKMKEKRNYFLSV